jgi:hypothetical protein
MGIVRKNQRKRKRRPAVCKKVKTLSHAPAPPTSSCLLARFKPTHVLVTTTGFGGDQGTINEGKDIIGTSDDHGAWWCQTLNRSFDLQPIEPGCLFRQIFTNPNYPGGTTAARTPPGRQYSFGEILEIWEAWLDQPNYPADRRVRWVFRLADATDPADYTKLTWVSDYVYSNHLVAASPTPVVLHRFLDVFQYPHGWYSDCGQEAGDIILTPMFD